MFRQILVPIDGSARSLKAARLAAKLAKAHKARITAIHVVPPFVPAMGDGLMVYPELYSAREYRKVVEKQAAKMLAKAERAVKSAGVSCAKVVATSNEPWRAIIRTARAKRCDLIVMASHGRRGLAGFLLGSETTKVLTHTRTPVLVCR